jgi:stress-induced morphogen
MPSPLTQQVQDKLAQALNTTHLHLVDNSWKHAGHVGNIMGGSHLAITLVSPRFEGLSVMQRHRLVRQVLQAEMAGPIHALEIQAFDPVQWAARPGEDDVTLGRSNG